MVTVAELVGSSDLAAEYIQENSIYLSRGHMAANSDFVYYAHQVRCDIRLLVSQDSKDWFLHSRMPHITSTIVCPSGGPSMVITGSILKTVPENS